LTNQGWKDSGDGIVNQDGSLAEAPVALVEAQAYCYMAKDLIADLFERAGEAERAQELRQQAAQFKERFNEDFWDRQTDFYYLALQKDNAPVAVISSNPGHALWAGIAGQDQAGKTAARLMEEDMFSGWGIRTLSTREKRYNPIGYHVGTVWPHDNGMIAEGLRAYGYDEAALQIFNGITEAAMHFESYRLPELFAGFPKDQYQVPVTFPTACHPQAWAAGSLLHMLEVLLGLKPDGFAARLLIQRPMLPEFVYQVELRGLRVGQARADLNFQREPDGTAAVRVLDIQGNLDVEVQRE
jgi:glycogen debranching enzyme